MKNLIKKSVAILVLAAASVSVGSAASGTWNTTTSGQLWSTPGDWLSSIVADGSGNTADFNSLNITADTTVHLDSARTIGNLVFGDTTTSSAGSWILDNNGTAGNILTLAGGTPTITVNALGTGKTATISAVLAGTSGLTKAGVGTLVLSGANTYSGGTTINGGTLSVGSTGTLGSNANTNNVGVSAGGILTLAAVGNVGSNQTITLTSTSGSLGVLGLGFNGVPTATIAQADTNGGVLALNAVTGYNTSLSTLLSGKNLFLGSIGTSTFTGAAGSVVTGNGTNYRLGGGGGQITFSTSNLFTSTNGVVVGSTATNGGGTVVISAAQNYSGGTTINAGTLSVGTSGTLGSNVNTNNVGVSAGGILTLAAVGNVGTTQTITLTSTSGSLGVLGLGFNGLPTATIAEADTNGGVLALNAVTGYNTDLSTLLAGKNLFLGSIGTSTFTGAAGTVVTGNGTNYRLGGGGGQITFNTTNLFTNTNGVVVGSAATNGGGTVVISAAQNYTGTTTINGGILNISSGGSLASGSAVTVSSGTGASALTIASGGTVGGNVTVAPSSGATVSNLSNSGTISGTLTINSSAVPAPIAVQANAVISGGATLNGGSSTGNITDDGQLTIAGSTALTMGTISSTGTGSAGSAGTGAIYYNSTYASGITLNFVDTKSFAWLAVGSGAIGSLNTTGTVYLYAYAQGATNPNSAWAYTMNMTGGTWNVGQVGQNNSSKIATGTTNIIGSSTFNLGVMSSWSGLAASNGGAYMHGTWNIGGASAGTMNITGGVSEAGGYSVVPTLGGINGLQFTVGNGGTLTTTTASTLGFQTVQATGQTTAQTTNSLTVNSGASVTTAGNFNIDNTTLAQTAATTTNSLTVNGGTFSNSGGILYIGNQNLANTFLETNTVTVAGGTLNQTGGAVSLGASGTAATNYANILNVSSGTMNVGTSASVQALQLGTASNTASTVSNTVNLSGGKLVVSGQISALAGTGQVNTFNWTGGQLTAGTVTATSATWTNAAGGGIASSVLNNTAGTFAPGDIGTGGKTILTGGYTQGASGTLAIDLGSTAIATAFQSGAAFYDTIAMTGALSLGGNLNVSLINGFGSTITAGNSFNIITATGVTGSFANVDAAGRVNLLTGGSIGISNTSSTVTLSGYSNGASLIWAGGVGGNAWDVGTTANFTKGGVSSVFTDGDVATFNNSGIANNTVNLNTTVSPSVVTFANTSGTYTVTGSGKISGSSTVTVNGTGGTVALNTANDYSGATSVTAGTLKLGNATALGSTAAGTTVSSGAVLDLNGQTVGAEALTLNGTGISSGGALINSSSTAASLSGLVTLGSASSIIASGGDITLSNAGTITGGTFDLTVGGANNTTITSIIGTTSGTLTKQDGGTLTLNGANTYTGATAINGGTVKLGNATALGTTAAGTTVATGAVLDLNGQTVGAEALTLSGTGISSGGALINSSGTAGSWAGTVALGSDSSIGGNGGTLTLSGVVSGNFNLTKVGSDTVILSNTANTFGSATTTFTIGTGTVQLGSATTALGVAANTVSVSSGAVLDLNGKAYSTANALTLNGTGISGGGALTNSSGTAGSYAGLVTLGSASSIIASGGNITLGNAGTITGSGFGLTVGGAQNTTITSIIGTGAGTLTKQDAGILSLAGLNTFSGGMFVNGGTVKSTANPTGGAGTITAGQFGTAGITMANGTGMTWSSQLTIANTVTTLNGDITMGAGSTQRLTWDPGALTLGGNTRTITVNPTDTLANLVNLAGASSVNGVRLNKSTPGVPISLDSGSTLRFVGGGAGGTWSGLNIYEMDPFNGNSTLDIGSQMLLTFNSATVLGNTAGTYARLIVENGGIVSLSNATTSNGQTIYSLSDGGGTGGIITNLATTAGTATLTISGNETKTFSGTIVDGANAGTGLAGVNGLVAVTKTGSGTQILSGANTYTGGTIVNAGTLLVNNTTGSGTGSGSVTVNSGGTLGGSGTISGAVTVNSGGTLSPGNSPGLLTIGGPLTLAGNANMEIVGTSRGIAGGYDAVDIGSSQLLTYGGTLTLTMTSGVADATYNLFSFTSGSKTGNFSSIAFAGGYYSGTWNRVADVWTSTLTQGQIFTFDQASGDLVAAVPEPATWALLAFSMTTVLVLRRRRNS